MYRLLKAAALATGLLLLASCPNPDNSGGGAPKVVTIKPIVDGYVDDGSVTPDPTEDFDSDLMYINIDESSDRSLVLMKFDTADLPFGHLIITAQLKLFCDTGPDSLDTIQAYRMSLTTLDGGETIIWDVTNIVETWAAGQNNGLLIESNPKDSGGQTVLSTREGEKSPKLEIVYR
jgi:hypothetical protein